MAELAAKRKPGAAALAPLEDACREAARTRQDEHGEGNPDRLRAPNALGQPTQAGTYATGVSYYPNGAIKQFTYGNGIVHAMTRNLRQLPERSRDALGSNVVLDDSYDYDANGNVAAITDGIAGGPGDRDITYDALDRLAGVVAGSAQGGNAIFAYDPLDNLRVLDQGSRQFRYHYDANNRLELFKSPS